jgi:flavin reductase (DIM6/NTAB) family NADH-FMN oxidoreductase RutF
MANQSSADLDQIDAALRLIDRELWVVTAADGPRRGGLLATWVSGSSIDRARPVLLAGLGPNHFTTELVQASKRFAAHLLRPDQTELAWNFANGSGRDRDKLIGLEVHTHENGSPILTDCLAWFDCRVFARYDAGDRIYFWADICSAHAPREQPIAHGAHISRSEMATQPLREHAFFGSLSAEQRQALLADRDAGVIRNRPLHEKWRLANPW